MNGIQIAKAPGDRIIELGGGACPSARPNVDGRQCLDANGKPMVDLVADFNEPLPIPAG